MCSKHNGNTTLGVVRGPAAIVLRSDTTHFLRAEYCELSRGVLTCKTANGTRSWSMREIKEVVWK